MSERNENELNDKDQQVTNEESEREIEENEGQIEEYNETEDAEQDVIRNKEQTVAGAVPEAPANNKAAIIVPWIFTVIAVAALVFVLVNKSSGGGLNETVAEMDGYTLKQSDVYAEMVKQTGGDEQLVTLVDSIAQTKLVELEAEKAGVTVTEEDMKSELENMKKQYGFATDEDLSAALQQSGITLEDFKEKQLKPGMLIEKLFESKNPVSEDDLKTYFDKNKDQFATTPKEVKASHILLNTKEEADAVLAELKAGKDFAALAKEKSQDPGSKDQGGDLGFFGTGQMDAAFEEAAFALAKGEMSDVVQSQFGYHIIKVFDVKEAVAPEYDKVKEDVKEAYYSEKKQTEGQAWVDSLKKQYNYKNLVKKAAEPTASASPEASATASPAASPSASPSASAKE